MLKPVDRPRVSHSYHKKPWRASQRAKAVDKVMKDIRLKLERITKI